MPQLSGSILEAKARESEPGTAFSALGLQIPLLSGFSDIIIFLIEENMRGPDMPDLCANYNTASLFMNNHERLCLEGKTCNYVSSESLKIMQL